MDDPEMSTIIDDILPEDELFEMILTTKNDCDSTNATPVGVTRSGDIVVLALSESSQSLHNLVSNGVGILNLVYDPLTFAESAFGLLSPDRLVEDSPVSRLKKARATIAVHLDAREDFIRRDRLGPSRFVRLYLKIQKSMVYRPPSPYSRKKAAAIEAVVAVTKAEVAHERGLSEIVEEMEKLVRELKNIAGGPDGSSKEAFELCSQRLDTMKRGEEGK
jgi:hypothetical protein